MPDRQFSECRWRPHLHSCCRVTFWALNITRSRKRRFVLLRLKPSCWSAILGLSTFLAMECDC